VTKNTSGREVDRFTLDFKNIFEITSTPTTNQNYLLEGHSFGPVEDITDTIHIANKGRMLDTLERFYIYRETQHDNQINDKLTVKSNAIFAALVQNDPHRAHATSSNHPAHT